MLFCRIHRKESTDFRYLLLDILQSEIYQLVSAESSYILNDPMIANNLIEPEIGKAVACTRLLSEAARQHSKTVKFDLKKSRPVLF